ncbi:NAD(P)-binding domain-containing protein [Oryzobacter telluris]|uniref:NAD(P)-binding domain-containing protein n=1 Tax=Oryzobacter telluris TaxID=3149179 RepID=UPI00370D74AD
MTAGAVVVVGAGSAGLAVSHRLRAAGVDHVVLERGRVAQAWRDRWDSFTLVTPNWTLRLPDSEPTGADPEGHVDREAIIAFLQGYAAGRAGSVREGVRVDAITRGATSRLRLVTSEGDLAADTVVVCTGAFQRPHLPAALSGLTGPAVLDSTSYRRPADLPDGRVLVVGSGQTGVQLAEELHLAGREVVLACGRAPWSPRRLDGLDVVTWLERAGFFDLPRSALPAPEARLWGNIQATGARGGHDLHYRVLQDLGVTLAGRVDRVADGWVSFAGDLAESVAFGDARLADLGRLLRDRLGRDAPEVPQPVPFVADPPRGIRVADLAAVLVTSGFRPDYARWVRLPVFDASGFPLTHEDLSTAVPGLYFCGVHFLRNRRSSLLWGVGDDADVVVRTLVRERVHP